MKVSIKELKDSFESYVLHGMFLLVEVLKRMKMPDLAKRQEKIRQEFLQRMENDKKRNNAEVSDGKR